MGRVKKFQAGEGETPLCFAESHDGSPCETPRVYLNLKKQRRTGGGAARRTCGGSCSGEISTFFFDLQLYTMLDVTFRENFPKGRESNFLVCKSRFQTLHFEQHPTSKIRLTHNTKARCGFKKHGGQTRVEPNQRQPQAAIREGHRRPQKRLFGGRG